MFTNRQSAITSMQIQQNRMIQAEDKAISQIAEITRALDDAMSGSIAFGQHHMTIMCFSDSSNNLENVISATEVELVNLEYFKHVKNGILRVPFGLNFQVILNILRVRLL